MKKLMIALAVTAAAAVSQAASVTWGSGYLKAPASATSGTASGALLSKTPGTWTAQLFIYADSLGTELVATDAMTLTATKDGFTVAHADDQGKFAPTTDGSVATTFANNVGMKTTTAKWDDLNLGTKYYAKVILNGDTADYTATKTSSLYEFETATSASGSATVNASAATAIPNFKDAAWTVEAKSVPEPTSAMLLLLGVAGLALRRRRA